jgi:hypothetical protein
MQLRAVHSLRIVNIQFYLSGNSESKPADILEMRSGDICRVADRDFPLTKVDAESRRELNHSD